MSTSGKICNDGASKSIEEEDDGICDVKDMLHKMSTDKDDKDVGLSVCANCGKEGSKLKACTACKLVKYCNRECQIAHRPQHKKECRKRAAELHDEKLFKQPPSKDDCPICFLQLPSLLTGRRYQSCCGNQICSGCAHAPVYDNQGNVVEEEKCPFCRVPKPESDEEILNRIEKRMEVGDPIAIHNRGMYYSEGLYGQPQNYTKALELWHRSAKLEHAASYSNIGYSYDGGEGVKVDKKKARHYYELAAIRGDVYARYNIGLIEKKAGNMGRAIRHYMIAVRGGDSQSLDRIKWLYSDGHATKEDYTEALRVYQEYLGEIRSDQRDKAAAADERYRYY